VPEHQLNLERWDESKGVVQRVAHSKLRSDFKWSEETE